MTGRLRALPVPLWALAAILFATSARVRAQVPTDFLLLAGSGGAMAAGERMALEIPASGAATVARIPVDSSPDVPPQPIAFQVDPSGMASLWQVVQDQGFFALDSFRSVDSIHDRSFATVLVVANGIAHRVTTRDVAVPALDAILRVLNDLTPGTNDLEYDAGPAPSWVERSYCQIAGKTDEAGYAVAAGPAPKRNDVSGAAGKAASAEVQAGTTVAVHLSLGEAVSRGIVRLEGKGGYFGDRVSITGDNTANQRGNEVTVTLNVQFYGPTSAPKNVERFKRAVESFWSGWSTTDGRTLKVVVNTRNSDESSPPGTAGYHNIELNVLTERSYVSNWGGFDANSGSAGGSWDPTGRMADRVYVHEAGHLMGIDDFYRDYNREPDGSWIAADGSGTLSEKDVADRLKEKYPNASYSEILAWMRTQTVLSVHHAGEVDNIMGNMGRVDGVPTPTPRPKQRDVDALAAKAGLIIDVRPGDILVNRNPYAQNLVVTHTTQLFVKPGETATLNGVFTACMDASRGTPGSGQRYDVAPPLGEWLGVEAAVGLLRLVALLDSTALHCGNDYNAQRAVWRLTDDQNHGNSAVETLLAAAGLDPAVSGADFPRLSNPNTGTDQTVVVVPYDLLRVEVMGEVDLVPVGAPVWLAGRLPASVPGLTMSAEWSIVGPQGSSAALEGGQTLTPTFTPDVRGTYTSKLALEVFDAGGAKVAEHADSTVTTVFDAWTDTFERADLHADPFRWWLGAANPWVIRDREGASGERGLRSGTIGHRAESEAVLVVESPTDGSVSFSRRVSSEDGYDYLRFSVDGTEVARWSGDRVWATFSTALPAGVHTLRWAYTKDGSDSRGADAAWIDDLFLPIGSVMTSNQGMDRPEGPGIESVYPNPFSQWTTVRYSVPATGRVMLEVFDALGRRAALLVVGTLEAGRHETRFDASHLKSGVYAVRLRAGTIERTREVVLFR